MYNQLSPEDAFKLIKTNYKAYLDRNTLTHIEAVDGNHRRQKNVEEVVIIITRFRATKENYLESLVTGPSMKEKMGRGVVSMLVGGAVAGGTFFASQHVSDVGAVFNPLGGAKEAVEGGFAGILGVASGALFYKVWNKLTEKEAVAEEEAVQKAMKKVGFGGDRFKTLSKDLVKLFHFRECLLLGLEDTTGDMREQLEKDIPARIRQAQQDDLNKFVNTAIEVFFLQALDDFFKIAFQGIYDFHENQITAEGNELAIIRRFRKYFESPEKRHRFTQHMQLQFIQTSVNFLLEQMNEKSFGAKHPLIMDSLVGLIAGSLLLGAIFAVAPIPSLAIVGAVGLSFLIMAALNHLAFFKIKALHFKRDANNRAGINTAIEDIKKEEKRLEALAACVIETSDIELKELKNFNNETSPFTFANFFHWHIASPLLIGSSMAWELEYSRRYNHSEITDVDLFELAKKTIEDARQQTQELQEVLRNYAKNIEKNKKCPDALLKVLASTQDYLLKGRTDAHRPFIEAFRMHQNIRQQILEIVAVLPAHTYPGLLPKELINFYTKPLEAGGLGGLPSDLDRVRSIAPVVPDTVPADANHPYHRLVNTAFTVNTRLNFAPNHNHILIGDKQYRKFLGLGTRPDVHLETQLDPTNIDEYLQASFDFLCSLNPYMDLHDTQDAWEKPAANTDMYNLYRMLLVRQLADLWNPTNFHIDNAIKQSIATFLTEKLECDASIALTAVRNQSLLVKEAEQHAICIQNDIGTSLAISNLAAAAAAISVDMAYDVSKPKSPKYLVELAAKESLTSNDSQLFFAINTEDQIQPETADNYPGLINQAIKDTNAFIHTLQTRDLLVKTGVLRLYIMEVQKTIAHLQQANTRFMVKLTSQTGTVDVETLSDQEKQQITQLMTQVNAALDGFDKALDTVLTTIPQFSVLHKFAMPQQPTTTSVSPVETSSNSLEDVPLHHGGHSVLDILKHPGEILHHDKNAREEALMPQPPIIEAQLAEGPPHQPGIKEVKKPQSDHAQQAATDPVVIEPAHTPAPAVIVETQHIEASEPHHDGLIHELSGMLDHLLHPHEDKQDHEQARSQTVTPKPNEVEPTHDALVKEHGAAESDRTLEASSVAANPDKLVIGPDPKHKAPRASSLLGSIFSSSQPVALKSYEIYRLELVAFINKSHQTETLSGVPITSAMKQTFAKAVLDAFDHIHAKNTLDTMPEFDPTTLKYAGSKHSNHLKPLIDDGLKLLGADKGQLLEDFLRSKLVTAASPSMVSIAL